MVPKLESHLAYPAQMEGMWTCTCTCNVLLHVLEVWSSPGGRGDTGEAPVELLGVEAERFVEGRALVVVKVHGDVNREAEEFGPGACLPVFHQLRPRLQDGREEVAMPVLVLLPISRPMG